MTETSFDHRQTAHCESGTISALLRHSGLDISEPMAFGISGALTFAYIPLVKVNGMPMIAYRMPPGSIIKGLSSRLGIKMRYKRFRDPDQGMLALNQILDSKKPVGLQTSVFWLPYFPKDLRFHFNAHNLVAYGYEDDTYFLSDPTFEAPVQADYASLQRARFVKGLLAPKGVLYYPEHIPDTPDLDTAICTAIKRTSNMMLRTPLPIIGVRGIRTIAKKIKKSENSNDAAMQAFVGHMVRMQEEIGTGGAGFRFIYASFLQEASVILDNPDLNEASIKLTETGDEWRRFALYSAKMIKGRMETDYNKLADQLFHVADLESEIYQLLRAAIK